MITAPGLTQYGTAVVIGLIVLLSLKEILSASGHWNKSLNSSFNMAITPLLVCFVMIVAFVTVSVIA
jgi:hypothetical protein